MHVAFLAPAAELTNGEKKPRSLAGSFLLLASLPGSEWLSAEAQQGPHLGAGSLLGEDAQEILREVAQERRVPVPVAAGPRHVRPAGKHTESTLGPGGPHGAAMGGTGASHPAPRLSWALENLTLPPRVSTSSGERKALPASLKSLGVVSRPRPTTSQAAFSFSLFHPASWQTAPRELYPCRALLIHFVSRTSKPSCTNSRTVCSGDLAQGGSKGRGSCFPPSPRSWLSSPMEQQQQQQRGGAPRRCPPTAVALPPFPTAAQPGGLPVPRDKRCGAPAVQHLAFWRGVKRSPPPGADFCHSTRSRSGSPGPSAVHVSGPRGCYLASCELHSSPLASAHPVLTN